MLIQRARILIVDDQVNSACLLEALLRRLRYADLTTCTDSRQVFGLIDHLRPDLVVLDLDMPYFDGFAVMERLHASTNKHRPMIVVLSGQNAQIVEPKARRAGASDFISKPFKSSDLHYRIATLLFERAEQGTEWIAKREFTPIGASEATQK